MSVADSPADVDYELGKLITETPKIVFSHSISKSLWPNTSVVEGSLRERIMQYKETPGQDLLIYGSASLASSLAKENLIDEYDLLANPVVVGKGVGIFQNLHDTLRLEFLSVRQFSCGVVLLRYKRTE